MTLSFGLAIVTPLVLIAFLQLSNANVSLSSIEAQQAADKLASIAAIIGSEGPPAKQTVQINMPPGVKYIYVGTSSDNVGHVIIFVVISQTGLSDVTAYSPINVSGNLGGITSPGTYLVNVSSESICPSQLSVGCVYLSPAV